MAYVETHTLVVSLAARLASHVARSLSNAVRVHR